MSRLFRRPACLLAVAVLAITVRDARAADGADQFDPVRERIAKGLVDTNLPSIAVAVARDGQIIWEQGFGWADRENRVPATEHTTYSLASISKPITATGLMVLRQRGKIDLDKPANDYLGEAKLVARVGDAAGATVRRVANHTSGLPLRSETNRIARLSGVQLGRTSIRSSRVRRVTGSSSESPPAIRPM